MRLNYFLGVLVTTTLLLVLTSIPEIHGDKILVLVFFSSKSHKITYMRLIEELAARGHEVTVVSSIKQAKPIKNIREVFTSDTEKVFGKVDFFELKESGSQAGPFQVFETMFKVCEATYDLPQVKSLLNEKFDLIFVQPLFNDCVMGMVHKLNAPMVLFTPTGISPSIAQVVGSYFPPSFSPNFMLPYSPEMTFPQRFISFGLDLVMNAYVHFYWFPRSAQIYREKLNDSSIPSVMEVFSEKTSLILSNGHFSLTGHRPYLPDIVDVGGIHSRPAQPLPKVNYRNELFGTEQ